MEVIEHQSDARLSAPETQASNPHVSSWLPLRPADYHNLSPSQRETGTPRKPGRAHGNHREQKHFHLIWLPITSRPGQIQTTDFQTEFECFFKLFGNSCFPFSQKFAQKISDFMK